LKLLIVLRPDSRVMAFVSENAMISQLDQPHVPLQYCNTWPVK
jgi:hypothetical protein